MTTNTTDVTITWNEIRVGDVFYEGNTRSEVVRVNRQGTNVTYVFLGLRDTDGSTGAVIREHDNRGYPAKQRIRVYRDSEI